MTIEHPGFRIFVLGAGFSRLAGLPLGSELFSEVQESIRRRHGRETKFERDLSRYREYRHACKNVCQSIEVDLEEFMSYLDIEHFLSLRGSDTWSGEGNESQIMVRKAIGRVIHGRTPETHCLPDAYYRFAEQISRHDVIVKFNYDVVLERTLEYVGKPYRLYPERFKSIGPTFNVVDSDVEEGVRIFCGKSKILCIICAIHATRRVFSQLSLAF